MRGPFSIGEFQAVAQRAREKAADEDAEHFEDEPVFERVRRAVAEVFGVEGVAGGVAGATACTDVATAVVKAPEAPRPRPITTKEASSTSPRPKPAQ
jgi:hypothetical protein